MTESEAGWAQTLAGPLVEALADSGYGVFPAALPAPLWQALAAELEHLDQQQVLQPAAIGRAESLRHVDAVRRDRTSWLSGESQPQRQLLLGLEQLRLAINRALYLGLFDLEAQFAIFQGGGFYRRHLDAFGRDNRRVVSLVMYLNSDWQPARGGQLRLWPSPHEPQAVADVAPLGGTLVCFLSEQIPHEVLPATGTRYSIAGWFRRNQ